MSYISLVSRTLAIKTAVSKPVRPAGFVRRAAILKAASELFLEHGYEKTSLSQILVRAGGSKSMIYEQFGDKAGLFRAVMLDLNENIFAMIVGDAPRGSDPELILKTVGRKFIKTLLDDKLLAITRLVYAEGPNHPEVAEIFFTQGYDAGFESLADYLETILPQRMPRARLLQLSMMFFEMMKGDAVDRRIASVKQQRSQRELNEQVDLAVQWLLQALGLSTPPVAPKRSTVPIQSKDHRG